MAAAWVVQEGPDKGAPPSLEHRLQNPARKLRFEPVFELMDHAATGHRNRPPQPATAASTARSTPPLTRTTCRFAT
jgi:hypothetical protein